MRKTTVPKGAVAKGECKKYDAIVTNANAKKNPILYFARLIVKNSIGVKLTNKNLIISRD